MTQVIYIPLDFVCYYFDLLELEDDLICTYTYSYAYYPAINP